MGGSVFLHTDTQLATRVAQLQQDPGAYHAEESARMAVVNANFDRCRHAEIGLAVFGLLALGVGRARGRAMLAGAGLGLALQAAFTLALDVFAEARADVYTAAILSL